MSPCPKNPLLSVNHGLPCLDVLFALHSQVTPLPRTAAVRLGRCQFGKRLGGVVGIPFDTLVRLDLVLIPPDELFSLLLVPGDFGFAPARWTSAVLVLDEKMGASNLAC